MSFFADGGRLSRWARVSFGLWLSSLVAEISGLRARLLSGPIRARFGGPSGGALGRPSGGPFWGLSGKSFGGPSGGHSGGNKGEGNAFAVRGGGVGGGVDVETVELTEATRTVGPRSRRY